MRLYLSKCILGLLLTMLVAGAIPAGEQTACLPSGSANGSWLGFGQSVALTDLDGDSVIDQATLDGVGFSKIIRISLSASKKASVLQFTTSSYSHGSLFAYDTNNDGDVDLVWTDLIHPDDVVVWLNDGTGQFERVCSRNYADTFIVGITGVSSHTWHARELAACLSHTRSLDQIGRDEAPLDLYNIVRISRRNEVFRSQVLNRSLAGRDPPAMSC